MVSVNKDSSSQRLEPAPGVLYVVGTPIGNLGDLSSRAKKILESVSIIACEDTRHSGILLGKLQCSARKLSFHEHNSNQRIPELLVFLKEGKSIALISDAGLPGISDPGEKLVSSTREAGFEVIPIPGPCAAITALISSGLPSSRFCFEGFLPARGKGRKEVLKNISEEKRTTIIYESPHRLIQLLEELAQLCSKDRPVHIARELTKFHEEHISCNINSALEYFLKNKPKGEFTLVLGGIKLNDKNQYNDEYILLKMKSLLKNGTSTNDAAKRLSIETGQSKRRIYNLLHSNIKNT